MTDKNHEHKSEGGCCGGAPKSVTTNNACSTEKADAAKTENKEKTGGCGCQ